MMSILTITKDNFEDEVLNTENTVLVDFWASWCGPCRMIAPIVEEIANEGHAGLIVGKVNVDDEPELAEAFDVMTIPTLIVFKNGEAVNQAIGAIPKAKIMELFQ